ncbi:SMI1/KNR4 family protein [Lysinibacillus sp. FSL K6-3209]|uniref:SMI1/KNR4 family protein n=1 Tax=Lysinibacillus sp. FSL K6-3209 TaxID=2921497 RepID=UPI0030D95F94
MNDMNDMNELQNKYQALYDFDGVTKESLDKIEHELQIKLPNDFREISGFYSGGIVGGIDIHSFQFSEPTNFIRETIRIREAVGLPNRFVVIAEQAESIIVMDTEKHHQSFG